MSFTHTNGEFHIIIHCNNNDNNNNKNNNNNKHFEIDSLFDCLYIFCIVPVDSMKLIIIVDSQDTTYHCIGQSG